MKSGQYNDLAEADYRAASEIAKSDLDLVRRDPALYEWRKNTPKFEDKDSPVKFGRLFHKFLLQPEVFERDHVAELDTRDMVDTIEDIKAILDSRGISYKKTARKPELMDILNLSAPEIRIKSMAEAEHNALYGDRIVTRADMQRLEGMRASVLAHPLMRDLLQGGQAEVSFFLQDMFKCRCDYLRENIIVDIKTTGNITDVERSIVKYRYHVQAGFYKHIVEQVTGEAHEFVFCFVGKSIDKEVYPVQVFTLPSEVEEIGYREAIEDYNVLCAFEQTPAIATLTSVKKFFKELRVESEIFY